MCLTLELNGKEAVGVDAQAGGGTVSKCDKAGSTLPKLLSKGVQLAIMSSSKVMSDAVVKQLVKAKVPCATAHFLIDWLAHPEASLNKHMLFNSQCCWNAQLQHAQQSRAITS